MRGGSVIHLVFTFLQRFNGPRQKYCLLVSLLLLTVLARHCLDTNGTTEAVGDRLPAKLRRNRALAHTLSVAVAANSSSDSDSDTDTDSAVGEGEDCEAAAGCDGEPPSEEACLASQLRRSLRLDDEGDAGFAEPGLCPGQLGLMTLGGEYKPMAVAYTECSLGLSWCPEAEQCVPTLRASVVLRRESWPFLGAARSPTQTWRSIRMLIPHSCYCGRQQQLAEEEQLQAAAAPDF